MYLHILHKRRKKEMGLVSSMISILFFSPSIEAMYEKRGGGISIGSTFLQTFIAISSVLVYVGDSRASAVSHSLSSSNQFSSANINHPDFIYSASFYSGDRLHRARRSSKKQPGYHSGNGNTVNHDKNTDLGQFIPYADSSYIGEPYFDYGDYNDGKGYDRSKETFQSSSGVVRSTIRNVTAQLGTTTYLHCRVNNLGGKTVSWLKRYGDTPHLLTFGLTTYSNDARIQIFHEQPNDWKLQIQFPRLDDEGVYECLVSANPPLVRRVRLVVVVPEIEIVDERDKPVKEKFYKGGSTIELKCIVKQIVGQAPEYIIWHHGNRMLNYDIERGGISVKTDLLTRGAISRLSIAFASNQDSGNYTCSMRSAQASVIVHILNGENPAAMQTGTSHKQSSSPLLLVLFILTGIQHLQKKAHN